MAKTYYTCLKTEHKLFSGKVLKAGALFAVTKTPNGMVACTALYSLDGTYYFTPELCKKIMIEPTLREEHAVEESFMIAEATYC